MNRITEGDADLDPIRQDIFIDESDFTMDEIKKAKKVNNLDPTISLLKCGCTVT